MVVTSKGLFLDKARLMPNCCFVIGYDTYVRLLDPKYYQASAAGTSNSDVMETVFGEMRDTGAKFIVSGRLVEDQF